MHVPPQIVMRWVEMGGICLLAICAATLGGIAIWMSRRPSAEVMEERRRKRLAELGRIVDGSLIDAEPADQTPPRTIIYTYKIAGVQYRCSQDVSTLGPLVADMRLDYPVQVRYRPDNPADSIVVAETWNGLWTNIWRASGHGLGSGSHAPVGR